MSFISNYSYITEHLGGCLRSLENASVLSDLSVFIFLDKDMAPGMCINICSYCEMRVLPGPSRARTGSES